MAYIDQTKKAKIVAALKAVMPKGWKYSLRIQHHSSITMTIQAAPVDLYTLCTYESKSESYIQLNTYYLENAYTDAEIVKVLKAAKAALDTDNFDKSDISADYFNVGHYVYMHVGAFERPFVCTAPAVAAEPKQELTAEEMKARIQQLEKQLGIPATM